MTGDLEGRIRRLEQRARGGEAELLRELVRRAQVEGTMAAGIAALERERGRPLELDPFFVERAERIWRGTRDLIDALFRVAPIS